MFRSLCAAAQERIHKVKGQRKHLTDITGNSRK